MWCAPTVISNTHARWDTPPPLHVFRHALHDAHVPDPDPNPAPQVLEIGESNHEIYYTDKSGYRNKECLSLGCDDVPIFWGRTPVQVYTDFIDAFSDRFQHMFGAWGGMGRGGGGGNCCELT